MDSNVGKVPEEIERILDRTPVILFHWRAEPGWPIDYVSANIRRFGYSPADFYAGKRTYTEIIHPDDRERVEREVDEVLRRGRTSGSYEYRILTRAGEVRWVEEQSTIQRDASGAAVTFEGAVFDITERKEHEQEQRRLQHFQQALLDSLPMPVFLRDSALVYRGCNRAFAQLVGIPYDRIIGATVRDLWAPKLAEKFARKDQELLEQGGVQIYESPIDTPDGRPREVLFHKATYCDENGKLAGIVGVIVDITDRNRALRELEDSRLQLESRVEERTADLLLANRELCRQIDEREQTERRLQESEERFRELADSLPQLVFETDLTGQLTWFNRNAYRMFGYEPGRVPPGLTALDTIAPEDRPRAQENIKKVLALCGPESAEYTGLRSDGSRFAVMVSARPIVRAGKVMGMRGIIVDINERVALERMKDEFLSIASHELRTPLTPLHLAIAHALRRLEQGQPVEAALLERMARQTRRLTDLVSDLLDVSRLERGTLVIRRVPTDLRALVQSVVEDFGSLFPDRAISVQLPEHPAPAIADSTRIEQVIANFLDNAVKYAPESPIEVRLSIEAGAVRLSVSDRGPGIAPEAKSHLFTRFFRAARPGQPGLGLGLFICQEIIRQLGGTIGVESELGRGSTFFFTLPLLDKGEAARQGAPAPTS